MKPTTGKTLVLETLFKDLTLGSRYQTNFVQYGHPHTIILAEFENGGYMVEVSRTGKQKRNPEYLVTRNFDTVMKYLNKRILKKTLDQLHRSSLKLAQ